MIAQLLYALLGVLLATALVAQGIIELGKGNYEGQIILVGGEGDHEGNIVIYHMSKWGLVCDDYWNIWGGLVVCRQLGYPGVDKVTMKGQFPQVLDRKIWMDNVQCKGNEDKLEECRFNGWGRHNCGPEEAAGVICKKHVPSTTPWPSTVQPMIQNDAPPRMHPLVYKIIGLAGGTDKNDGYIQVEVAGLKGVICADHWTLKEAEIVCQQLGKHHATTAYKDLSFGGDDQYKLLGGITCEGHEKTLEKCFHEQVLNEVMCESKYLVAGVSCSEFLPDLIPDVKLLQKTVYIQDQPIYFMACAMEEGCAARSAYTIMRTSRNWHIYRRRLLRFSSNVFNNGTADFRPLIPKNRWEWHSCHMHYHSMEVFAEYDLLDYRGNRVAQGHKASFCLEDSGGCGKGFKRKYWCENYGDQGISVGCADLYAHDIDCQWIDITDVKPGRNYILKIKVNPENKVAELNYDNNEMTCNLYYSGSSASARGCKLTKP